MGERRGGKRGEGRGEEVEGREGRVEEWGVKGMGNEGGGGGMGGGMGGGKGGTRMVGDGNGRGRRGRRG